MTILYVIRMFYASVSAVLYNCQCYKLNVVLNSWQYEVPEGQSAFLAKV